jgi:glycosyltransferase involved in cell wall biosynthesis
MGTMVDVCLVVEGSYPYVTGGVSSWTHSLLEGLPDVSFTVAHVRDAGDPDLPHAYALPAGTELVHVDMDPADGRVPAGAHLALPEARVYHAACTGAAGEVARLAAAELDAAFALTEHGIAWREARWGISGCKRWPGLPEIITGCKRRPGYPEIITGCKRRPGYPEVITGCKRWEDARTWTREEALRRADQVLAMAMRSYAEADAVTSVCGPNAVAQRALGAPAERLAVLPNAVAAPHAERTEHHGLLFGFVGRVVAVKDVATFLHACAMVAARRPDAEFVVVGPTDHEPEYADEMQALAAELALPVTFTGEADPAPWYARMDALVLTSLSEAQPLVALEAMAAGVPVVATDVGGCREAIGPAGLLTPVRYPDATAAALLRLADDDALRARLGAAGRARATTTHAPERVYGAYREMYERLAA